MVDTGGIFAGLIFAAAVAGLIAVNEINYVSSFESTTNSETIVTSQTSQDEIVMALNDMNAKLVTFFSDLKDDLDFL
jgi:phosphoribosylanthranilate isomerase